MWCIDSPLHFKVWLISFHLPSLNYVGLSNKLLYQRINKFTKRSNWKVDATTNILSENSYPTLTLHEHVMMLDTLKRRFKSLLIFFFNANYLEKFHVANQNISFQNRFLKLSKRNVYYICFPLRALISLTLSCGLFKYMILPIALRYHKTKRKGRVAGELNKRLYTNLL